MKFFGSIAGILACLLLFPIFFLETGYTEIPSVSIRQNHLLFEFGHDEGKPICAVQEIVVVLSTEETDQPVRLSIPLNAKRVAPMPVPPVMPGMEGIKPLQNDEVGISEGQILIKRRILAGKNIFSFGYILPVESDDAVRLEKQILIPTYLLAAFAPEVASLTSRTLDVEKAEGGYKILGRDLPVGKTVDLTFEGIHQAMATQNERRDGSDMPTGESPVKPALGNSSTNLHWLVFPSLTGALLALMLFSYGIHLKKRKTATDEFKKFLLDEIESLDNAAEKKEINTEFHKHRKKELMDRLRSLSS